jgi:ribosomal subunit interface protein
MQITITARHFELTKAIRDHVETACLKIKKYFDHIITIHVTLAWENITACLKVRSPESIRGKRLVPCD